MTERRTRRVTAIDKPEINGEAPWADVVEDLTWGELKALREKAPLQSASYDDASAAISKYIVAWNLQGYIADTGELEPIEPPASAPIAFDCVEPWVISWLFLTMHQIHMGGADLQKKPTPITATPDSRSASA
jgi:hypothetical protein